MGTGNDLVYESPFLGFGGRHPAFLFHQGDNLLQAFAATVDVLLCNHQVNGFRALLLVLQFLDGILQLVRIELAPDVHSQAAFMRQPHAVLVHLDGLGTECQYSGCRSVEADELHRHVTVLGHQGGHGDRFGHITAITGNLQAYRLAFGLVKKVFQIVFVVPVTVNRSE